MDAQGTRVSQDCEASQVVVATRHEGRAPRAGEAEVTLVAGWSGADGTLAVADARAVLTIVG